MGCCDNNCCAQSEQDGKIRFANPILPEVHQAVPHIAKMLGVSINEVEILDGWAFPTHHQTTDYCDHPVKTAGLIEDLPFIVVDRLHTKKGVPGYGMVLYECRGMRDYKYVQYITKDPGHGWRLSFFGCKKGEVARVIRNCKKMEKKAGKNVPPILREGLLEEIVKNSIHFLLNSKKIEKYGVRIRRGILLDGPPGNGKTMACRYIQKLCTDNNITWGIVNASDIEKAFNENAMEQLFGRYTVTFFDDIDIQYLSRKAGRGQIACSILSSMDGMCDSGHTIRIFTTNEKIDDLDEAFKRPGRIDKRFLFEKPDAELRAKLIASWPDEIIQAIDVDELVEKTEDRTFAELEAIRANLVTNFLFGDNTWNLKKSLEEFKEGAGSFSAKYRPSLGFTDKPRPTPSNGHKITLAPCGKN